MFYILYPYFLLKLNIIKRRSITFRRYPLFFGYIQDLLEQFQIFVINSDCLGMKTSADIDGFVSFFRFFYRFIHQPRIMSDNVSIKFLFVPFLELRHSRNVQTGKSHILPAMRRHLYKSVRIFSWLAYFITVE